MKPFHFPLFLTIILSLLNVISGAKILFYFGGGSYSHKHSVWPWTEALAEKGHEVTFLSAHEKKPSVNSKVRDLASPTLHKMMSRSYDVDRFEEREKGDQVNILSSYSKVTAEMCRLTILHSEEDDQILHSLLFNETFDLVIVNSIFGECGFVFGHHYKAKIIAYDASVMLSWYYSIYGFNADPSWIPDILSTFPPISLPFFERVMTFYYNAFWYFDRKFNMHPAFDDIVRKAWPEKVADGSLPTFEEMEKNVSMIFVNSHHSFDLAVPVPPLVVYMGGINAWLPEKEIPEKYQTFMDGSGPGGVVLISFGSTVRLETVKPFYSKMFFDLVKRHPKVRFLMKWSGPLPKEFEGLGNLLVSDWLPQRELLRHPKLKAFITHGGLNSMQEATYYGVPLVVIPLFADQDYNAYRVEVQEVGFRLEIRDLNIEALDISLTKILANEKYKKNMKIKSEMFKDRPQSPLETVLYWTEFVLRHQNFSSLKPMNDHLSWGQRRLLDVYALLFGTLFLSLLLTVYIGWKCVKVGNGKQPNKRSESDVKKKKKL